MGLFSCHRKGRAGASDHHALNDGVYAGALDHYKDSAKTEDDKQAAYKDTIFMAARCRCSAIVSNTFGKGDLRKVMDSGEMEQTEKKMALCCPLEG